MAGPKKKRPTQVKEPPKKKLEPEIKCRDYSWANERLLPEIFSQESLGEIYCEFARDYGLPAGPYPSFVGVTDVNADGSCFFHAVRVAMGDKDLSIKGSSDLRRSCLDQLESLILQPQHKRYLYALISMDLFLDRLSSLIKKKVVLTGADFTGDAEAKTEQFRELIQLYCESDAQDRLRPDLCAVVLHAFGVYRRAMEKSTMYADDAMAMAACDFIDRDIIVFAYSLDFEGKPIHCHSKSAVKRKGAPVFLVQITWSVDQGHFYVLRTECQTSVLPLLPSQQGSSDENTAIELMTDFHHDPIEVVDLTVIPDEEIVALKPISKPASPADDDMLSFLIISVFQNKLCKTAIDLKLTQLVLACLNKINASDRTTSGPAIANFAFAIEAHMTLIRHHLYTVLKNFERLPTGGNSQMKFQWLVKLCQAGFVEFRIDTLQLAAICKDPSTMYMVTKSHTLTTRGISDANTKADANVDGDELTDGIVVDTAEEKEKRYIRRMFHAFGQGVALEILHSILQGQVYAHQIQQYLDVGNNGEVIEPKAYFELPVHVRMFIEIASALVVYWTNSSHKTNQDASICNPSPPPSPSDIISRFSDAHAVLIQYRQLILDGHFQPSSQLLEDAIKKVSKGRKTSTLSQHNQPNGGNKSDDPALPLVRAIPQAPLAERPPHTSPVPHHQPSALLPAKVAPSKSSAHTSPPRRTRLSADLTPPRRDMRKETPAAGSSSRGHSAQQVVSASAQQVVSAPRSKRGKKRKKWQINKKKAPVSGSAIGQEKERSRSAKRKGVVNPAVALANSIRKAVFPRTMSDYYTQQLRALEEMSRGPVAKHRKYVVLEELVRFDTRTYSGLLDYLHRQLECLSSECPSIVHSSASPQPTKRLYVPLTAKQKDYRATFDEITLVLEPLTEFLRVFLERFFPFYFGFKVVEPVLIASVEGCDNQNLHLDYEIPNHLRDVSFCDGWQNGTMSYSALLTLEENTVLRVLRQHKSKGFVIKKVTVVKPGSLVLFAGNLYHAGSAYNSSLNLRLHVHIQCSKIPKSSYLQFARDITLPSEDEISDCEDGTIDCEGEGGGGSGSDGSSSSDEGEGGGFGNDSSSSDEGEGGGSGNDSSSSDEGEGGVSGNDSSSSDEEGGRRKMIRRRGASGEGSAEPAAMLGAPVTPESRSPAAATYLSSIISSVSSFAVRTLSPSK